VRDEREHRVDLERRFLDFAVLALSRPIGTANAILYVRGVLSADLSHCIRSMTGQ
jgi:hypothetical protein